MTRSELIQRLAGRFPQLTLLDAELSVKLLLELITSTLAHGNRVEIRGFGSFYVNQRAARQGRNPASGAPVRVPPKSVPMFKPGQELRARVMAGGRATPLHHSTPEMP